MCSAKQRNCLKLYSYFSKKFHSKGIIIHDSVYAHFEGLTVGLQTFVAVRSGWSTHLDKRNVWPTDWATWLMTSHQMTWMTSNNFQNSQNLQSQSLSCKGREKSYLFQGIVYAVFCHFKNSVRNLKSDQLKSKYLLYHQSLQNGYIHSLEAITFILKNVFCFLLFFTFVAVVGTIKW